MHQYQLYGLTLASELPLPSLQPIDATTVDIHARLAKVSSEGVEEPRKSGLFFQTADQCLWLHVQGIARFLVRNGNEILIDPEQDADRQSICLYLLGSCMGAILHQRGLLVLHANTIAIGDKAVIFAGPSGIGKSTLAAAFHQRGYPLLTDDICAINDQLHVVPGLPQLKLWPDSAEQLNINTSGLKRIRLQINKYAMPISTGFAQQAYPLASVYFLHSHNQDSIRFEAALGWECYKPLKNNTYRMGFNRGMGLEPNHLKQCSRLSQTANMWHLYRPKRFQLELLLVELEQHFQQQGLL